MIYYLRLATDDLFGEGSKKDEPTAPVGTFQLTSKVLVSMIKSTGRLMDKGISCAGIMQVLTGRFPEYALDAQVAVYEGLQPDRSPATATEEDTALGDGRATYQRNYGRCRGHRPG